MGSCYADQVASIAKIGELWFVEAALVVEIGRCRIVGNAGQQNGGRGRRFGKLHYPCRSLSGARASIPEIQRAWSLDSGFRQRAASSRVRRACTIASDAEHCTPV